MERIFKYFNYTRASHNVPLNSADFGLALMTKSSCTTLNLGIALIKTYTALKPWTNADKITCTALKPWINTET